MSLQPLHVDDEDMNDINEPQEIPQHQRDAASRLAASHFACSWTFKSSSSVVSSTILRSGNASTRARGEKGRLQAKVRWSSSEVILFFALQEEASSLRQRSMDSIREMESRRCLLTSLQHFVMDRLMTSMDWYSIRPFEYVRYCVVSQTWIWIRWTAQLAASLQQHCGAAFHISSLYNFSTLGSSTPSLFAFSCFVFVSQMPLILIFTFMAM